MMRLLPLAAAAVLAACSETGPSPAGAAASAAAPAASDTALTVPTSAEALPALVGESAPSRALACYAMTTLHAETAAGRAQGRFARTAEVWAAAVLQGANGDGALAERRRAAAVATLRPTAEGVRRAAVVRCAQPPVPGADAMTPDDRQMAEMALSDRLLGDVTGSTTAADLPDLIGEGAESRTVNCQTFTALQAAALSGAEQARYQAASDAWALRNHDENGGNRDAAAQLMASTVAVLNTNPPLESAVLRVGADQCLLPLPPTDLRLRE